MSTVFTKEKQKLISHMCYDGKELIAIAYRNNGHVVYGFFFSILTDSTRKELHSLEEHYVVDFDEASEFFKKIQTHLWPTLPIESLELVKKENL